MGEKSVVESLALEGIIHFGKPSKLEPIYIGKNYYVGVYRCPTLKIGVTNRVGVDSLLAEMPSIGAHHLTIG